MVLIPLAFRDAAFTSSSAFFIDAAANTVMDFCCAAAGIAESAIAAIAKSKTRRQVMAVLRSRGVTRELLNIGWIREPPFRGVEGARPARHGRSILVIWRGTSNRTACCQAH